MYDMLNQFFDKVVPHNGIFCQNHVALMSYLKPVNSTVYYDGLTFERGTIMLNISIPIQDTIEPYTLEESIQAWLDSHGNVSVLCKLCEFKPNGEMVSLKFKLEQTKERNPKSHYVMQYTDYEDKTEIVGIVYGNKNQVSEYGADYLLKNHNIIAFSSDYIFEDYRTTQTITLRTAFHTLKFIPVSSHVIL